MSAPHIVWDKGGEAWVLALDADGAKLRSSVPSPPGSRLDGRAGGESVRFKVHVCQAVAAPEKGFVLVGRPLDMKRTVREALVALVQADAAPENG